jgi:hypothetical protein
VVIDEMEGQVFSHLGFGNNVDLNPKLLKVYLKTHIPQADDTEAYPILWCMCI